MTIASHAYGVRIGQAAAGAEVASSWMNAADALIGSMSAMESSYPTAGSTFPFLPRDRVEIVHLASGKVVASLRERRDVARGLAELIGRDLDELEIDDFETEWNVSPPDEAIK